MKRISKLVYVLLGIGILAAGCSEDEIAKKTPANPGDAIVFGAAASIENGSPDSRTVYGDKGDVFQVINWVEGDMIRIACAQAAQAKEADYTVKDITAGSTSDDHESSASTLVKQDVGLQWGTGEHTFYAVYPSPAHFTITDENQQPHTKLNGSKVSGVLASVQTPDGWVWSGSQYVMSPDMDQAYMAARAHYNAAKEGGEGVTLHFKPLVTAIEVEVKAGVIGANTGNNTLTLTGLRLRSASGKNLVGKFSADISALNNDAAIISNVTVADESPTGIMTSNVSVSIPDGGVELLQDQSVIATFFILPTAVYEDGNTDLKLDVSFMYDGVGTTKTCTLGKEIKAHRKYYFSNITMPDVGKEEITSDWVSRLQDNILISQLSIPGAGNAASAGAANYWEQEKSLTELWNLGVRCFELVTDYTDQQSWGTWSSTPGNLAECQIWCGGQRLTKTFGEAFDELQGLLEANRDEFLIIICSYQAAGPSRNPQNYMDAFNNSYSNLDGTKVVALNPNSTVGDLRGKIAFIGKITQYGEDETNGVLPELINVPTWFTYIPGWGSFKDKWNMRYGNQYNAGYNFPHGSTSGKNVEDRLWQTGDNETTPNWSPSPSGYPTPAPNFTYDVSTGGKAWVQEWMRVVPATGVIKNLAGTGFIITRPPYLFINWPASYQEKYDNITATFEKAKNEQDKLYINSLSGYYVTPDNADSYTPMVYKGSSSVTVNGDTYNLNKGDGGLGGDFDAYNKDIMTDVYNYVSGQVDANTTGPMGIVMMDYIGCDDNATRLPALIYENNFKFPLITNGSASPSPAPKHDAAYSNGGNAIGWE